LRGHQQRQIADRVVQALAIAKRIERRFPWQSTLRLSRCRYWGSGIAAAARVPAMIGFHPSLRSCRREASTSLSGMLLPHEPRGLRRNLLKPRLGSKYRCRLSLKHRDESLIRACIKDRLRFGSQAAAGPQDEPRFGSPSLRNLGRHFIDRSE